MHTSSFTALNDEAETKDIDIYDKLDWNETAENGRFPSHSDYICVTLSVTKVDPLSLFQNMEQHAVHASAFWHQPERECGFVAGPVLNRFTSESDNHFLDFKNTIQKQRVTDLNNVEIPEHITIPFWIGGLQFNAATGGEDARLPSCFFIPEWIYVFKKNRAYLRLYMAVNSGLSPANVKNEAQRYLNNVVQLIESANVDISADYGITNTSDQYQQDDVTRNWQHAVNHIKQLIGQRELKKLVLARSLKVMVPDSVRISSILYHLSEYYPSCTNLMISTGNNAQFIASTPEHILTINNHSIYTESLAGSISRGAEIVADEQQKHELMDSDKNLNEHCIVRDDIICQLESIVTRLDFPKKPLIKQLSNVQHLFTPIHATLKNNINVFSLLNRLHPTPAVGGYPRYRITKLIKQIEGFDRGWYASPVGWIDTSNNAEFVVGLRSGILKNDSITLFAGCGIVRESEPAEEWHETNLKFMPLLNALNIR